MRLLQAALLAGQAIVLVQGQRWTLHESCGTFLPSSLYNQSLTGSIVTDLTLQAAVIKAMKAVKDKTANAVNQLENSKGDSGGLVAKAATLFLGKDNYAGRVDEANGKLFSSMQSLELIISMYNYSLTLFRQDIYRSSLLWRVR